MAHIYVKKKLNMIIDKINKQNKVGYTYNVLMSLQLTLFTHIYEEALYEFYTYGLSEAYINHSILYI